MSFEAELLEIERRIIEAAIPVNRPVFVHMLGIPGSGKSSFLKILQQAWLQKSSATLLGFDQVMQSMPSYQNIDDKILGFEKYEIPARLAGYRILEGLLKKRTHILFDNGGSAESHPDMLRRARDELGYRLVFIYMKTPIEVARMRVNARAIQAGQHTPLHYLEERAAKLDRLIGTYQTLSPSFYEFDNSVGNLDEMRHHSEQFISNIFHEIGLSSCGITSSRN